ncbi:MAG: CHRD domain-containing protein [Verrucomicrobia bacterium]|nr:CHRD domain-containing protein [Verrucomicrobiota bacterium]
MIAPTVRGLILAGALGALAAKLPAQIVEFRAALTPQQEVPATSSPASGSAILLYDVAANTFDLVVSITGMTNTATASHLHEAAAGSNGGVVTNLGGEAAYTRSGSTLRATFRNVTHGGDRLKLLQGGAYFNIHSAQFPGGEIRGQLIPRPVRLYANMDVAQEQAAFPAVNLSGLNDFGAAILLYDPMANTVSIRASLFNFRNAFTNSHIHEGAPGVSGPARTQLGTNANAGAYSSANGHISGAHDIPYVGDPVLLLTGGMYVNYHSATFSGGELRGQIRVSSELPGTRFANLAVRGFVGTGEQVLIQGISVNGTEPIRALLTAKGPSLSAFGISGALANPRLALYDSGGREIAVNDDVGTVAAGSELAAIPGVPRNSAESALLVVLPPGNYTAVVSAVTGTGIALLEVADLRTLGATGLTVTAQTGGEPSRAAALAAEMCEVSPAAKTAGSP